MLVEFHVKNFRSLRDEQVLSLVASSDKTLEDSHTLSTEVSAVPRVLKSAVIYGANAGGKSNLIRALQYMRGVVVESATLQPGQSFSVQPFRLDEQYSEQPTEFEITFIKKGVRYQYGFSLTQQRIVSEHLLVYKAFKPQTWFERFYDDETDSDIYTFSSYLHGSKSMWEKATRPNSLFLSMAAQLNSAALQPIFDWFRQGLVIFNEQARLNPQMAIDMLRDEEGRKKICDFLLSADISLADIEVVTRKVQGRTLRFDTTGEPKMVSGEVDEHQLRFIHRTERGNIAFDIEDESGGTRNLLFLAAPLLDILKRGKVFVIDEMDTSLHTLLVRAVVNLFHNPKTNTGGAQLIFTTHDTSLLDAYGLFRRDQIWFVEKTPRQSSKLTALSEFSPRKNEALEKGYLTGRYGALPFLAYSLGREE